MNLKNLALKLSEESTGIRRADDNPVQRYQPVLLEPLRLPVEPLWRPEPLDTVERPSLPVRALALNLEALTAEQKAQPFQPWGPFPSKPTSMRVPVPLKSRDSASPLEPALDRTPQKLPSSFGPMNFPCLIIRRCLKICKVLLGAAILYVTIFGQPMKLLEAVALIPAVLIELLRA